MMLTVSCFGLDLGRKWLFSIMLYTLFFFGIHTAMADSAVDEAIKLAQSDNIGSAIYRLEQILVHDPENIQARLQLARYLSWTGRLKSASSHADKVLQQSFNNIDVLVIKADAAAWRGDYSTAIAVYELVLFNREDFETRASYTDALLNSGDIVGAVQSRELLVASNPSQMKQLRKIDKELRKKQEIHLIAGRLVYDDTDNNMRHETHLAIRIPIKNMSIDLYANHIEAEDAIRKNRAIESAISLDYPITASLGLKAGVGITELHDIDEKRFTIGHLGMHARVMDWILDAKLSKDILIDTAQIIENQIQIDEADIRINYLATDYISFRLKALLREYSDDNRSWNSKFNFRYKLRLKKPRVNIGYRREQSRFDTQTGSGYFDPDKLVSDQAVAEISYREKHFNVVLELFYGRQVSDRFGQQNDDGIGGYYLTARYDLDQRLALELEAEGGDYALGSVSGFTYYQANLRLVASF